MMRYMIVNNAGDATLYSLERVKEVINLITYLNAGESLKIVAVWLDND